MNAGNRGKFLGLKWESFFKILRLYNSVKVLLSSYHDLEMGDRCLEKVKNVLL